MAISVAQRNMVGNAGASSSPTLAYGSNVTNGNALIAVSFIDKSTDPSATPTDTIGNTFALCGAEQLNGSCRIKVWIAQNGTTAADTVTFTTGLNDSAVAIFEVAGIATSGAFDKVKSQGQTSATALDSTSTATTTNSNELLLGLTMNLNAVALNPTIGAGYSNLQTAGVVFSSAATEEKIVSATGTYNATFTLAANTTTELTAIFTFSDTAIVNINVANWKRPTNQPHNSYFKPTIEMV